MTDNMLKGVNGPVCSADEFSEAFERAREAGFFSEEHSNYLVHLMIGNMRLDEASAYIDSLKADLKVGDAS